MQAAKEFALSLITLAVVQVKQEFALKDWDEGTLDNMGCYTPQSECLSGWGDVAAVSTFVSSWPVFCAKTQVQNNPCGGCC